MITKYNKIICAICAICGLMSCSDQLELTPQGELTVEQLDNSSIDGLLSSAYHGLEAHFFDGNFNPSFSGPITNWIFDVRSDDAYKGGEGVSMESNIHQLEISNITSDNPTCQYKWENNYLAIARVHKTMLAVQDVDVNGKESMLGELKTLRAYFYFDLNRLFKSIPYFTEKDNPQEVSNGNLSREEIYNRIITDLQEAYAVLPETQSQPGRFNKYVAAAILCKVNAQISKWAEVEKWADIIIKSGKYGLYPKFGDLSKIENNNGKESIMAIQFSTSGNNIHINYCNLLNTTRSDGNLFGSGDDFFLASQNLVNAFRTDASGLPILDGTFNDVKVDGSYTGSVDPRLDYTVGRIGYPFRGHVYTAGWCRDYATYGEYSGKKGLIDPSCPDMVQGFPWGASGLNFMLIRYADILLLKAEALIEQAAGANAATDAKLVEARSLINQVRQRAIDSNDASYSPKDLDPVKADYFIALYPSATTADNLAWTQNRARLAVRMERRLELAMEGHRWFDLVRWGTAVETINKYMKEESELRPYYNGASISEDELYLPVPIAQIENSNGLYHQ